MAANSGISWAGGRDIKSMQLQVKRKRDGLKREAAEALALTVQEGAQETEDFLEAAVTATGERRVASGRGSFAGRHLSGTMVGAIGHDDITDVSLSARIITMAFGWFPGSFEAYFRDQDLGEGNIPAARALPQAYYRAVERFRGRMSRIVRGKNWK